MMINDVYFVSFATKVCGFERGVLLEMSLLVNDLRRKIKAIA
jgi:hypothetical protein